eukprot:COSAG06_NODE_21572_length_752_cov_1.883614_1_plen_169_part_01
MLMLMRRRSSCNGQQPPPPPEILLPISMWMDVDAVLITLNGPSSGSASTSRPGCSYHCAADTAGCTSRYAADCRLSLSSDQLDTAIALEPFAIIIAELFRNLDVSASIKYHTPSHTRARYAGTVGDESGMKDRRRRSKHQQEGCASTQDKRDERQQSRQRTWRTGCRSG